MVGEKTHEKVTELNFVVHECSYVQTRSASRAINSLPSKRRGARSMGTNMSATRVLLQLRGVYVSGIGEQGTDQEPMCIEKIQLSILY